MKDQCCVQLLVRSLEAARHGCFGFRSQAMIVGEPALVLFWRHVLAGAGSLEYVQVCWRCEARGLVPAVVEVGSGPVSSEERR